MSKRLLSIILPTFHRPDDVNNFLDSLTKQEEKNFEVMIVDGSLSDILQPVVKKYEPKLDIKYFYRKGLGASESRNLGCEHAKGDYLLFIDSDCIIPSHYIKTINQFLDKHKVDGFGGADASHPSFTPKQKAIDYAMTSFFTTGGIRGKKAHIGKFQLRGFNMGVSREAFDHVNGFSGMQVAEDLDISMRLIKAGYKTALIPEAFVYHRRKTNFRKFFKQLFMHGKGRIELFLRHRDALKPLHFVPSAFVLYLLAGIIVSPLYTPGFIFFVGTLLLYILAIFLDASMSKKSLYVGILSIWSSFKMLIAYGLGLLRNVIYILILGNKKLTVKAADLKE